MKQHRIILIYENCFQLSIGASQFFWKNKLMNSNLSVLERQFRFRNDSIKLYSNKIYIFKKLFGKLFEG